MINDFVGYGGCYNTYMDAHHCWLTQKDFSDYRRVKVPAGTNFGYLKTKKDFEIVCGWWNRTYTDSYEKEGGNVRSHVGVKEWDWSFDHFRFNKSDADKDIINSFACGFQSIWKYYIKRQDSGLSGSVIAKIKEYLEECPRDFLYLVKDEDMIEVPYTTSLDDYCSIMESNSKYHKDVKNDILNRMIDYFWNPQVTNVSIDRDKLGELIGKIDVGAFVTTTYDEPGICYFGKFERQYSRHKRLIDILSANGFEVVPEAELKAKEKEIYAKSVNEQNNQKSKEKRKRDKYKGKWWLVKWSGNWADEIDLEAFSVMNDAEKRKFKKDMNSDEPLNLCIGTNEDMDMTYREYYDSCEFIEIKDAATREFLLDNCQSDASWAPHNVC